MDTDISFAEAVLRQGAGMLQSGAPAETAQELPLDVLARLLATAAATDSPLVVLSEGGGQPELFDEAARLSASPLTGRVALLAAVRQAERAVVFEFDGTGPLTGNRVVAAVLRPEDRQDLLDTYVAVGRLRDGVAQLTAAPASLRFDAAALGQTLALIGTAAQASQNAAAAALGHAARVLPMPGQPADGSPGHPAGGMPAVLLDLFWHALALAAVRARREALGAMEPRGSA